MQLAGELIFGNSTIPMKQTIDDEYFFMFFAEVFYTKIHWIVCSKQLTKKDFLRSTKVFCRFGFEWHHGLSHFGYHSKRYENISVQKDINVNQNIFFCLFITIEIKLLSKCELNKMAAKERLVHKIRVLSTSHSNR